MSLAEAEWIANNYLPDEPRPDEIAAWRASQPRPEPARQQRGLDTMPAEPPIDIPAVVQAALRAERVVLTEATGQALAEYCNTFGDELLADVSNMVAAAIAELKAELKEEFARQIAELSGRIDSVQAHSAEVKAEVEKILARRKRTRAAKTNGSPLMLPAPLADATRSNGNGDGREH